MPISPLTQNEIIALGEAWSPIANQYLGQNSMWVMPVVITAPILLQRLAEIAKAKKEKPRKLKTTFCRWCPTTVVKRSSRDQ